NYSATADVLRYSLVDEHGGIYLDTDDTLVRHVMVFN
ncbi:glycosyltransferase, partial [Candidatus Regiella insecticola]